MNEFILKTFIICLILLITLGCRNVRAGQKTIKQHISTDASIELYELDLKSFTSVKSFAQQILTKHDQIHLLINNGKF